MWFMWFNKINGIHRNKEVKLWLEVLKDASLHDLAVKRSQEDYLYINNLYYWKDMILNYIVTCSENTW